MKLFFSLLTMFILNKDCSEQKPADTSLNTEMSKMMQETTTISYKESTRGFYERVWIAKDSITITNDRSHVEKISIPTPENDWKELMELLNDVSIQDLPTLKAPTGLRHSDAAYFTTLVVTQNNVETSTDSFDNGHPPKAIEALINKVLSMRKMLKKQ